MRDTETKEYCGKEEWSKGESRTRQEKEKSRGGGRVWRRLPARVAGCGNPAKLDVSQECYERCLLVSYTSQSPHLPQVMNTANCVEMT